jgi:hypothetical protein
VEKNSSQWIFGLEEGGKGEGYFLKLIFVSEAVFLVVCDPLMNELRVT